MRRSLPFNAVVITGAALAAAVLSVVHRSPSGLLSYQLDTREVRAAPGQSAVLRHDLSALKVFNLTLVRVKDRYVDPTRLDPRKMLLGALDSVQFNIPEVLVEPDDSRQQVSIRVNDKREVFSIADVDSPWRLVGKLKKVFRFVETNMNPGADLADVEYAAVNGMLSTLDPHSVLMDPEAARDMDVSTSGKFGGLGIVIRMVNRKLTVIRPMKGTPAWKKGIKPGDHIVKINEDPTDNLTSDESVDRMRGEPRTPVTLWVSRKGEPALLRFDLIRDVIMVKSVESKLLSKNVGYIRIRSFSSKTAADTAAAMRELAAQGAATWIVDLRWNPGGLLDQSIQVSDLFVDRGAVVTTVSTRKREIHDASRSYGDTGSSVAVLVNPASASASEIVAGALKNLDRAIIIGNRTFGKGSVQELFDNQDGSKLKLTVAQYLTPGDRSIQSVGIVPDVQLTAMQVPLKNDSPSDRVRLLPPSRLHGEKDLDAHLTSTYAKDAERPSHELSFVFERPGAANAKAASETDEDEEEEGPPDDDEIVEDFEIRFARDLLAANPAAQRKQLVAAAQKLIDQVRTQEEAKLASLVSKLSIDWSAPPAGASSAATGARLTASLSSVPTKQVKAGELVKLTGTVKNEGTAPAYRVHARLQTDDGIFEDAELLFGKIAPGETKTFTTQVQIPKSASDRVDRLALEMHEARNAPATATPATLQVEALPRPVFAYSYHLIDAGNGDGFVQPQEKYRLRILVKNTGEGTAAETTALLRNASGDGIAIEKSRFELGEVKPGETRSVEFPFSTTSRLEGGEAAIEVLMYDGVLGAQASEKLRFPIKAPVAIAAQRGTAIVKAKSTTLRMAPAAEAVSLGVIDGKTALTTLGTTSGWTKIEMPTGAYGFVQSQDLAKGSGSAFAYRQRWHSTPPALSVASKGLETTAATYTLSGKASDDTHVEDVYVYVSNRDAKINGRKVFYRSNRGAGDRRQLDFSVDIPLWPGSNQVMVVARENSDVSTVRTMYIYRDSTKTAAVGGQ